jgi:hypothetical protein
MLGSMVTMWADPWSPDFGMGFEAPSEDTPLPRVEPDVETGDWTRARPGGGPAPAELWFVDGVRRVEVRVLADDDGRRISGLFGSYAVGAVRCDGTARFDEHRVRRAVVLGGGVLPERVDVPCGPAVLSFDPIADERSDPNGPLERLQELMRREEESIASHALARGAPLVLADGPLRLNEPGQWPTVGVVKRFVRRYLDPDRECLLAQLRPGERTPVFGIADVAGTVRGFSWYARIAGLRPAWHDHAGLVRCEVRAGPGVAAAVELADGVTAALPRFAGRAADPRTPQNLAPVAGLESWLRHRMGDRAMIHRALVMMLARQREEVAG